MVDFTEEQRTSIVSCFHLSVLGARQCLRLYERPGESHSQIVCPRPAMYRIKIDDDQSEFLCTWCFMLYGSYYSSSPEDVQRAPHADAIEGLVDALSEPASLLTFNPDVIEDARQFLLALPPCNEEKDCPRCVWMPNVAGRLALYELTRAFSDEAPFDSWPSDPVDDFHRLLQQTAASDATLN